MRNCERHHFSLASASMEYIFKNNLPLVNQWTQDIWTKFCAWLMDESEPDAIVLEEGGKPTKDNPAKPMEPLTSVHDVSPESPYNVAEIRKVLTGFVHDFASFREDVEHGKLHMMQCMDFIKGFIPHMEAALAAPARNCDVGTADEQAERFDAECKRHEHCTPCPVHAAWGEFKKGKPKSCQAIWGQMPYAQKEGVKEC